MSLSTRTPPSVLHGRLRKLTTYLRAKYHMHITGCISEGPTHGYPRERSVVKLLPKVQSAVDSMARRGEGGAGYALVGGMFCDLWCLSRKSLASYYHGARPR